MEVLSLIYSGASLLVTCDAVEAFTDENGKPAVRTVVGVPCPVAKFAMGELGAELEADVRSVLARLDPLVRVRFADAEARPEVMRARIASDVQRHAAIEAQIEERKAELVRIAAESVAAGGRLAELEKIEAAKIAAIEADGT